jgi:Ni/Fe-hydrogenase subunit HybB-like protein
MQADPSAPTTGRGYAADEVTKPPDWHHLVAWDMLFNNMTTGLFLASAAGDLARPGLFVPLTRVAYPLTLLILTADLLCLILDLGDPLRFHHMLRVFKPSSPMSLGTWCLTAYSLPLATIAAIDLFSSGEGVLGGVRTIAVVVGVLPALGSMAYKGVLFSTTSQPAWKDARWLGGYLTTSALMLGSAVLLAISALLQRDETTGLLRVAFAVLLLLNLIPTGLVLAEFLPTLRAIEDRSGLLRRGLVAAGLGMLAPLGLVLVGTRPWIVAGVVCLLLGNLLIRSAIVAIPHRVAER